MRALEAMMIDDKKGKGKDGKDVEKDDDGDIKKNGKVNQKREEERLM